MIRLIALFPLLLLLAGCGGGGSNNASAAAEPTALVTLAPVQSGALASVTTLYGAADAGGSSTATLAAPADARVARIEAPVGTAVAAGQPVVVLAPASTTILDLVRAQTDARAANAAYARQRRLRADGLVGNSEVEQARAAAATAGATRASLAQRAAGLTLRAPLAGYVQTIASTPGDLVTAGAAVATLTRGSGLRARFGVDPALAATLHAGRPIRITVSGTTAVVVPIASIAPIADPQTRLISVFADLPATVRVAVGQTLAGEVSETASGAPGLSIPYAALLDDGGQPYVFAVTANHVAHRRDVATGPTQGDRIAILHGLADGDRVVVEGGTALEDGMQVRTR